MTPAQLRLVDTIRQYGGADDGPNGGADYWDVINDWVKASAGGLMLHNARRTVDALLAQGAITLDEDGRFHIRAPERGGRTR